MFDLAARRVRAQFVERGESGFECAARTESVEIKDGDGNAKLDDARDGIRVRHTCGCKSEAHEFTGRLRVVERTRAVGGAKVGEVAREQVGGEIFVAVRETRRVRVELAPEMYAAIERIVRLEDEAAREFALETDVHLIAFRDTQLGVEAAREVCPEHAELFDDG